MDPNPPTEPSSDDFDPSQTVAIPRPVLSQPTTLPEDVWHIHVEVVGGPMDGRTARAGRAVFQIGRGDENDLDLPLDRVVSTRHARIVREGRHYWLEDLGSRNGTFLGDHRLTERTLIGAGSTFTVGRTQLEFHAPMNLPRFSPEGDRILAAATQESTELGHRYIGVEHLFLGLARERSAQLTTAFKSAGLELDVFVDALRRRVRGGNDVPGEEHAFTPRCIEVLSLAGKVAASHETHHVEGAHLVEAIFREGRSVPLRFLRALGADLMALREALRVEPKAKPAPASLLERFGRDLTALAQRGQLSPVIGRQPEMDLLSQVLLRRNKNNPVLVGEAGVGKTAVVEGFAQLLTSEACPEPLLGKRLVELSLGSLVAGTKYRGEFEERMLGIAKELEAHPEIIIFLDEIHTLVGAGSTGGGEALDASNIFKPALARGEIRCIGATTIDEYRRHIEPDPALDRRFEKVLVEEPSKDEALEILGRLRPVLEEHHELRIDPEALEAAVELTTQHVKDRQLPDKALDALDQACARKRLERFARESESAGGVLVPQPVVVTEEDIASTVSQWTGIPLERVSGEAARTLLGLEDELLKTVVGQDAAVRAVSKTILTAKAGLADKDRPLGVFFFAGPTGVGKTHLAKTLAEVLFGDAKRLVRVDMSEYMQEHAVSNLIGAPPGYVGHEREGTLISALRTHPHSIVLFDEVEKAHPRVFDLFLQIFDEGRLTGSHGKSADFTQAIVILTSNIRPDPELAKTIGFGSAEGETADDPDAARANLHRHLRPELINRIDQVIEFAPLAPAALRRIVDLYIGELAARLRERSFDLVIEEPVYAWLLERGESDTYGARELRRLVDRDLRQPLAEEILKLTDEAGTIRVSVLGDRLVFETELEGRGLMA